MKECRSSSIQWMSQLSMFFLFILDFTSKVLVSPRAGYSCICWAQILQKVVKKSVTYLRDDTSSCSSSSYLILVAWLMVSSSSWMLRKKNYIQKSKLKVHNFILIKTTCFEGIIFLLLSHAISYPRDIPYLLFFGRKRDIPYQYKS